MEWRRMESTFSVEESPSDVLAPNSERQARTMWGRGVVRATLLVLLTAQATADSTGSTSSFTTASFPAPSTEGDVTKPAPTTINFPAPGPNYPSPDWDTCEGHCGKTSSVCSCTFDCQDYGDCCGTSASDVKGFFYWGCDETTTTTTSTTTTTTTTTTEQLCTSTSCLAVGKHCDYWMAFDSDYNCLVLENEFGCDCSGCYCGGFDFDTTTTTFYQQTTTTTLADTTPDVTTTTVYIDTEKFGVCRKLLCKCIGRQLLYAYDLQIKLHATACECVHTCALM